MSRYPGSDADGYRAWGVVTPQRQSRPSFTTLREEFAPVVLQTIKKEGKELIVQVTARADFPARILRNYHLQYGSTSIKLNTLQPGESQQLKLVAAGRWCSVADGTRRILSVVEGSSGVKR